MLNYFLTDGTWVNYLKSSIYEHLRGNLVVIELISSVYYLILVTLS